MKLENEKCPNMFLCALNGIKTAIKTEKNLKFDLIVAVIVIVFGFMLRINCIEWIVCIISIGLMLFAELINTAVEYVVDLCTREKNELAKKAKDISAGGVLVLSFNVAIIGIIIFAPKIVNFIQGSK